MDYEKMYNDLATAIRNNTPYYDLTMMVGPSEEETEQAESRIKRLNILTPKCNWSSQNPTGSELEYRKIYNRQVNLQSEHEAKYF